MKKHTEECTGCISKAGEEICFSELEEMERYYNLNRNRVLAALEDYIYDPIYNFLRWKVWEAVRPGMAKHYYQRAKRGYSYMDVWDTGYHVTSILLPMLEDLKKNRIGTPITFYRKKDGVDKDGNPTDEATRLADERYDNVLREMIFGLKCAKLVNEYEYKDEAEYKKLERSAKRSLELFSKYWCVLWD